MQAIMNRTFAILFAVFSLVGVISFASQADTVSEQCLPPQDRESLALVQTARSPGGCSSELCCHKQMQQCYDNGGNEECSDQYESCVRSLSN